LHFHQPPIDWFLFNTILDIHMVGGFSLFFHACVGNGVFKSLLYISKSIKKPTITSLVHVVITRSQSLESTNQLPTCVIFVLFSLKVL
jgi:hypothetical protein